MNFHTLVQLLDEGSYYNIPMHQQIAGGRRTADNAATANLGLGLTSGSSETNRAYTPAAEAEEHIKTRDIIDGIEQKIEQRIENIQNTSPEMRFAIGQLEALLSDIKSLRC